MVLISSVFRRRVSESGLSSTMPALLTRISKRPASDFTVAAALAMDSDEETSSGRTEMELPLRGWSLAAAALPLVMSREPRKTW